MDHRISRFDLDIVKAPIASTSEAGGRRIDATIGFDGMTPIYDVIVGNVVVYAGHDLEMAILNYNEYVGGEYAAA